MTGKMAISYAWPDNKVVSDFQFLVDNLTNPLFSISIGAMGFFWTIVGALFFSILILAILLVFCTDNNPNDPRKGSSSLTTTVKGSVANGMDKAGSDLKQQQQLANTESLKQTGEIGKPSSANNKINAGDSADKVGQ